MSEPAYLKKNKRYKKRYAQWAGNMEGVKPDYSCCAASVYDDFSKLWLQCARKRSTGPDNAYCWQHAKKHRPPPRVVSATGAGKRVPPENFERNKGK